MLVCDTHHGNVEKSEPEADAVEHVTLTRDEVRRSRVRATTETGREIGVVIDRRLRDGDVVHDDGFAVVVSLEPVEAFAVELDALTTEEAAALGHELGNAHHEMAFEGGVAYVPADEETRAVLDTLADEAVGRAEVEPSVFDAAADGVANAHNHGHEHDHAHGEAHTQTNRHDGGDEQTHGDEGKDHTHEKHGNS
jgi:urease accessory protein